MNIKIYYNYIKELFTLASPMIMGNLGAMLIGAGSVFVAAKHSTDTLAAISIANSIISCILIFGMGLLTSVSPALSNRRGHKDKIKQYFIPTIEYAMVIAFFSMIAIFMFIPVIQMVGFDPKLMPMIKQFMFISAFSTFGVFLQICLKEFLQAYEIVFFPNFLAFIGIFLNLILNFALVFGMFGLPAMGSNGLAVADFIMRTAMGIILLIYCLRFINVKNYFEFRYFVLLTKIGLPIACGLLLEFIAFNIGTIIMGHISGLYAACQNILITLTSITFMIPLGISNALAVKVGFYNGAENYEYMKRYSIAGVFVSAAFMALCSFFLWGMPETIIRIFSADVNIIKISIPCLIIIGFYQIFDGLQVSLGGIFKGIKKTKYIVIGDFVAYWIFGLPLGFLLALKFHMNLFGYWIGLAVSIFSLSIILGFCLIPQFKKIKKRIEGHMATRNARNAG